MKALESDAGSVLGDHNGVMDDDLYEVLFGDDDVTPEGMAIVRERMVEVIGNRKWKRLE